MNEIQNISNLIFSIKDKLTDNEFKQIYDNLLTLHREEDLDQEICNQFYRSFFMHNSVNNFQFHYYYNNKDLSLTCIHEQNVKTFNCNDEFIYEKDYNFDTKETIDQIAKIQRITPKFVFLEMHNLVIKKKNHTFCKHYFYPKINII